MQFSCFFLNQTVNKRSAIKTQNSFLIIGIIVQVDSSFKFKKQVEPPGHKFLKMFIFQDKHVVGI